MLHRSMRYRKLSATTALVAGAALLSACGGGAESTEEASGGLDLVQDGQLTVCATFTIPPNIFQNEEGEEIGAEVDIAEAVATNMDLELGFREYDFSGLVTSLQGQQCDAIMSSLYITEEREEIAEFVPYLLSGSAVAVPESNPADVSGYDESLCGTRAIAITGATGASLLEEQSEECEADGEEPIAITLTDRSADALQSIMAEQQDAFVDTSEIVSYYENESDGDFQMIGEPFGEIEIGAATLRENEELHEAMQAAFDEIVEDGTYEDILSEWGFERQDIRNA
ncbi:ABC transporter substrate-binding protein [Nesterenkonia sp. NBAIMH1]|nr:ABC transporter substrate-binding protein [Nesterenkonia sp. NBAIMH1]